MLKNEYLSSLYTIFEPPNLNAKLGGHEAKNGEDGEAGGEGGHAVANAHDHSVPQDVVVEPETKVVTIICNMAQAEDSYVAHIANDQQKYVVHADI